MTGLLLGVGARAGQEGGSVDAPSARSARWGVGLTSAVREAFDSNVFLQDETQAGDHASFVTTWLGQATGTWTSAPWKARLGYQPEASFFHAEPTEDFFAHRAQAELSFDRGGTRAELSGSAALFDGDSEGPTWTGPGGAPATGGPAIRDRRDAAVYRGGLRLTQAWGPWLVRPTATGYDHDFRTAQRIAPGYQNYVDRKEFTVGADFGNRLAPPLSVGLGYRYGEQDESPLLGFPEEYDSRFHRLLGWVEGRVLPWLDVAVSAGPEMRRYGDRVPASFGDHDEANFFVDASLTLTPGKSDKVTVSAKQFEQPGFGGRSAYEDLTFDVGWRHGLTKRWTVGVGGRAYNTDFLAPVVRNDWVLSVHGLVQCNLTQALAAEGSYQFEEGSTEDPQASAREYTRHLVSLGLKYTFR